MFNAVFNTIQKFKMISRQNYSSCYIKSCYKYYITKRLASQDLLAPAYRPSIVEDKYERWMKKGLFQPKYDNEQKTFSMVLPPPNVTGKLHLGHALTCTIQDVIARKMRASGNNVVWVPGIDHAGIATQTVVEKHLRSTQNINRQTLGREKFNEEVWNWKDENGNTIINQLKTLGCSLDWTKETFTMNESHTNAVNTAFVQLFKNGLIYRKKSLVNWCSALQSTVSDIEVESLDINNVTELNLHGYNTPVRFGQLYTFAYKIFGTTEEIKVSTTMPETMLGDVAIAVHPKDERYKHLISRRAYHPFRNITIPIILDEFVDPEFGTGAVKITPAHSKVDYEVAQRHKLPLIQVFDENGVVNDLELTTNMFKGLKKYECRDVLVNELKIKGLLKDISPHKMTLPVCSRTGDVIECMPKEQWFLNCKELNKKALKLVKTGRLVIEPEKFVKNWHDWCKADRDWCISRQLWWGHQIPAYKCTSGDNVVWVAAYDKKSAQREAAIHLRIMPKYVTAERDSDVLDTWFSSGIYPFAALGWPDKTEDYKMFYPLNLMVTGHDILGFWVHRMVLLGSELTNIQPFRNVLLHGVICDNKGAKMSKSKGNVIDPIDVINGISLDALNEKAERMHTNGILSKNELKKALAYYKANFTNTKGIPECGVDALRFTLLSQDIKSHFVNFDVAYCQANKLFCNKIWQSIRYLKLCRTKLRDAQETTLGHLTFFDRWILTKLSNMVRDVNKHMDDHNFHLATKALKTLIYSQMCDIYIEATKPGFNDTANIQSGYAHCHTLAAVLNTSLRCLNPFMIYLTDELIPKIPDFEDNLIVNFRDLDKDYFTFPKAKEFEGWNNLEIEQRGDKLIDALVLIRELKGQYCITDKARPYININTSDYSLRETFKNNIEFIKNFTKTSNVDFNTTVNENFVKGYVDSSTEVSVEVVGEDIRSVISTRREKIMKRITQLQSTLLALEVRLSNESYISTMSEFKLVAEREKFLSKKEELKQLQRFVSYGEEQKLKVS